MDECDCHFEDVLGPGYPLMRMATAHCPTHGDAAAQGMIRIEPPQGALLPAEERLQNVLKAIEDRLLTEQRSLHNCQDLYELDMGHVDLEDVERQRGFVSGLDIAWSLAKTESLRREDAD